MWNRSKIQKEYGNKAKKIIVSTLLICIGICAGIFFVCFQKMKYENREVLLSFAISDVTVHSKWENEEIYAQISTGKEMPLKIDKYFFEPVTLRVMSVSVFEKIEINSGRYTSAMIRITIPYKEASELQLLDSEEKVDLLKVLTNKEYVEKYCILEGIKR